VEVVYLEQVLRLSLEPLGVVVALTLGAMSIATGVVGDLQVPALVTLTDVSTQGRGPTSDEISQHLALLARSGIVVEEVVFMSSEDVGHFGPIFSHGVRSAPRAAFSRS
jgi:hypothetical protein